MAGGCVTRRGEQCFCHGACDHRREVCYGSRLPLTTAAANARAPRSRLAFCAQVARSIQDGGGPRTSSILVDYPARQGSRHNAPAVRPDAAA